MASEYRRASTAAVYILAPCASLVKRFGVQVPLLARMLVCFVDINQTPKAHAIRSISDISHMPLTPPLVLAVVASFFGRIPAASFHLRLLGRGWSSSTNVGFTSTYLRLNSQKIRDLFARRFLRRSRCQNMWHLCSGSCTEEKKRREEKRGEQKRSLGSRDQVESTARQCALVY